MFRRAYLETGATLAASIAAGCAQFIPSQPEPTPPPDSEEWSTKPSVTGAIEEASDDDLIVDEHGFAIAGDDARVRGKVTNTDESPQPVTVTVKLFREDEMGAPVAEREADQASLDAGAAWEFTVISADVNAPEISRYTVLTD